MTKTRVAFGKEHREFYPTGEYYRNLAAKAAGRRPRGRRDDDAASSSDEPELIPA